MTVQVELKKPQHLYYLTVGQHAAHLQFQRVLGIIKRLGCVLWEIDYFLDVLSVHLTPPSR